MFEYKLEGQLKLFEIIVVDNCNLLIYTLEMTSPN